MKITNLTHGYFYGLLNEANVFNVTEPYTFTNDDGEKFDVSLTKYLDFYLQFFNDPNIEKMFIKKLTKLLVNDERYLHHVRKLPDNAPEWAVKAVKAKTLVVFKSEQELDSVLEHMSHYLAALEEDVMSENQDIATFAEREIKGFPKAESLDLLAKKSQDYFKRGTKKSDRSEEGLVQIHDHGDGYKWFLLKNQAAFEREGKSLQNCIGKQYTAAKAKAEGYAMIVLRKPNGASVVAASVKNKVDKIDEMKGKNNKAPLEKYMVYVIKFINDFQPGKGKKGFGLTDKAIHDFRRAGNFYIDKVMYNRTEAIKAFIKTEELASFPDGNKLLRIKTTNQNKLVTEIFRDLYPELQTGYNKNPEIYELRNSNNNPLVSGAVENKKLEKVQRHKSLRESIFESVIKGKATKEFVGELIRRGIIDSINDKMSRDLFWNERIQINRTKGTFDPVKPEKEIDSSEDKDKVTWQKHIDDDAVAMIMQSLKSSSGGYSDDEKWDKMKIHQVYITKEKMLDSEHDNFETDAKHFALVKREDDVLIPVLVHMSEDRVTTQDVGSINDEFKRTKMVKGSAALANSEGLTLSRSFAYNNGLVREKGKYKIFEPKLVKMEGSDGVPSAIRIDLNKIPPGDRFAAINHVIVAGKIRFRGDKDADDHEDKLYKHDTEMQLKMDYVLDKKDYARGDSLWTSQANEDSNNWDDFNPDTMFRTVFGGKEPDTIFLVNVEYGKGKKHQILMIADGKTVVEVDGATERHQFQNWGDHESVALQMVAFANEHKLTFTQDSIGDSEEFRIHNGHLSTGAMIHKSKLKDLQASGKIGQEGVDELKFKDGTVLQRMDVDDQAMWVRRGLDAKSIDGEAWKFVNKKDEFIGIIVVNNQTVQDIYAPDATWDNEEGTMVPGTTLLDTTNRIAISADLIDYVSAARAKLGWKTNVEQQGYTIKPESKQHKLLIQANAHEEMKSDDQVAKLYNLGLVKIKGGWESGTRQGKKKIPLTAKGRQALELLDAGEEANVFELKSRVKLV